MKRLLAVLLAALMLVTFAGCSSKTEETEKEEETTTTETTTTTDEVKVMSYAEFAAAEVGAECTIEAYVQAHQSWWDNAIKVYLADKDGGYYVYDMACTEEDAAKLTTGTKIRVTGVKSDYKGEIEIYQDDLGNPPTFEFVEGGDTYVADPVDVTDLVGTDDLAGHINQYVQFTDVTVVDVLYNWDGSGKHGDDVDMYMDVECPNGATLNVTVPRYLCGLDSETYTAVEALKAGDKVTLCGFLYYYDSPNPHITTVIAE